MIEYKSKIFISALALVIVFSIIGGVLFLLSIGNGSYLNLISASLACVIAILLVKIHRYVIPWIRGFTGFQIAISLVFILSGGCMALLGDTSNRTTLQNVFLYGDSVFTVVVSTVLYLLTPKFIVLVPKPITDTEIIPDAVIAEKLKMPKNK